MPWRAVALIDRLLRTLYLLVKFFDPLLGFLDVSMYRRVVKIVLLFSVLGFGLGGLNGFRHLALSLVQLTLGFGNFLLALVLGGFDIALSRSNFAVVLLFGLGSECLELRKTNFVICLEIRRLLLNFPLLLIPFRLSGGKTGLSKTKTECNLSFDLIEALMG